MTFTVKFYIINQFAINKILYANKTENGYFNQFPMAIPFNQHEKF